ncbi:MAG TPA: tetrahydrofolate dehydrogenase/cyclohydrolase catalytic domain-containing protein [Patescibacteria group bacterium]|nr:tetrahydrofolate dehydrogenase/cyclohydrolase catalytic domain-containing protein [Patescibacteria group bacterium]
MAIIFDGKLFAFQKSEELKKDVLDLNTKGLFPHLASIVIGDNPASKLYVSLKKKAGEKIGIQVDVYYLPETTKKEDLLTLINTLNMDNEVSGIMIQLPIPGELSSFKDEIIGTIYKEKDVDGLRDDSPFIHPTSKAAIEILNYAKTLSDINQLIISKICVVGSTGMVGKPLVKELKEEGYEVIECDSLTKDIKNLTLKADVIISATGVFNIVKADMVKEGAIIIDIGSPKGDFEESVSQKAGFFTPVPGGVGPVTISYLLDNLIKSKKGIYNTH